LETYERFSYHDELLGDTIETSISMKLSRCVFNPPNRAIHWDKLKFLCPTRIDVTSKSVKNLVLSYCGDNLSAWDFYTDTIKINAPYILSLTIKGIMYLEELLLENVSSLVKDDLNFWCSVVGGGGCNGVVVVPNVVRVRIQERHSLADEIGHQEEMSSANKNTA
ncbi:hypothetical protein Tco_0764658, partial [Tanacetum coccineum]